MKLRTLTTLFLSIFIYSTGFAETPVPLADAITAISKSGYDTYRIVWHPENDGFYNAIAYNPAFETWAFIQINPNGEIKNEAIVSRPSALRSNPTTLNIMPAVNKVTEEGYIPLTATWTPTAVQIDARKPDNTVVVLKV